MMLWLPDATRHEYGTSGGTWTDTGDPKGCLHTTEGGGWPSYDSGAKAPHATVMPIPGKGVQVRQHTPFDRAARALRNPPGGVQTNRDRVYQFELIGTCAKGGPGYYWPDADDAVLADLYRKVIHPVSVAFGIPEIAPQWLAYPASYGNSRVRMSGSQFDHYTGWLGHQHVPENDHGDPGAFPWSRMIAAVTAAPNHPDAPQEDDMTPEQAKKLDEIHDRLYGIFPQRYYVTDPDGRAREVPADTDGAKPARGLDELHGNVIVTDIRRALAGLTTLSKAAGQQASPDDIAAAVVDAVGAGVAAQVVDALAVRLNTKRGA